MYAYPNINSDILWLGFLRVSLLLIFQNPLALYHQRSTISTTSFNWCRLNWRATLQCSVQVRPILFQLLGGCRCVTLSQHSKWSFSKDSLSLNDFLQYLEPIGSVPPKITSLHDKFQVLQVKLAEDYSMQCPGQAYPVPIVRLVSISLTNIQ